MKKLTNAGKNIYRVYFTLAGVDRNMVVVASNYRVEAKSIVHNRLVAEGRKLIGKGKNGESKNLLSFIHLHEHLSVIPKYAPLG